MRNNNPRKSPRRAGGGTGPRFVRADQFINETLGPNATPRPSPFAPVAAPDVAPPARPAGEPNEEPKTDEQ